jgi:hypothetical protein
LYCPTGEPGYCGGIILAVKLINRLPGHFFPAFSFFIERRDPVVQFTWQFQMKLK